MFFYHESLVMIALHEITNLFAVFRLELYLFSFYSCSFLDFVCFIFHFLFILGKRLFLSCKCKLNGCWLWDSCRHAAFEGIEYFLLTFNMLRIWFIYNFFFHVVLHGSLLCSVEFDHFVLPIGFTLGKLTKLFFLISIIGNILNLVFFLHSPSFFLVTEIPVCCQCGSVFVNLLLQFSWYVNPLLPLCYYAFFRRMSYCALVCNIIWCFFCH